jgi:multisubunit Na+/H+ antiporter MnhB subunit
MRKTLFAGIIALAMLMASVFLSPPGICFIAGMVLIWAALIIRAFMGEISKKAENRMAMIVLLLSVFTIIMNVGFYIPF